MPPLVMETSASAAVPPAGRLAGFTLIELLVTIALASVLMAVAVPSFNQMVVSSRLTTQANEFVAAISLARSEAIKRNRSLSLCRVESPTATDCVTGQGPWEHWVVRNAVGAVILRSDIKTYSGALLVRSTFSADTVVFGADGLASTGDALVNDHLIDICFARTAADNARQIVLGAGSRVSTSVLAEDCQ